MQAPLHDKVIAITGGLGALGRGVADCLQAQGAKVVLIDKATVHEAVKPHARLHVLGGVDLLSPGAVERVFKDAAALHGRLDGLVNVAGGFRWETVEAGALDTWDLMYAMNVQTALVASKAALPYLLESGEGRIVNVAALASLQAGMGMGAYAASKSGVCRLTEALAEELKDRHITVNAVLPSIIDTPVNRQDMPDADFTRWVQPTELASVIAFLLQGAASAVTGALIPVRGRV